MSEEKLYTLEDIKDAYMAGYYEENSIAWDMDFTVMPGYDLSDDATVHKPMNEFIDAIHSKKQDKNEPITILKDES